MSQHDPSIPTAILVPKPPRRRVKLPLFEGEIPWTKIAIIGSVVWVGIMLMMALYLAIQPQAQRFNDAEDLAARPVKPAAQDRPPEKPKKADDGNEELAVLPAGKGEIVECARIGTEVRFMKAPVEAFKRAKEEGKMVFMVHLSGNLEDKDFT